MIRWLIWLGFTTVWTVLLLLPGEQYANAGVETWPPMMKIYATKGAHLLAYTLMAFLSGWVRLPVRYRFMLLFFVMFHATYTELLQMNIQGRSGSLEDVSLNEAGVLLGLLAGWRWWTDPR